MSVSNFMPCLFEVFHPGDCAYHPNHTPRCLQVFGDQLRALLDAVHVWPDAAAVLGDGGAAEKHRLEAGGRPAGLLPLPAHQVSREEV